MRLKIDLDEQTSKRLIDMSLEENRAIPWQAEMMLRQSLGLSQKETPTIERVEMLLREATDLLLTIKPNSGLMSE